MPEHLSNMLNEDKEMLLRSAFCDEISLWLPETFSIQFLHATSCTLVLENFANSLLYLPPFSNVFEYSPQARLVFNANMTSIAYEIKRINFKLTCASNLEL